MVFQSTGQPPFDSLNVLYTLSWVQHPTSVIFAIIKRKVSGHFKGFDPLKRCFPSLFPLPAPFWVTAAGETKTSRMENFGSMGTTPTHPLTLESVPLKPVWPVRSQCGSVCSQPASLCSARQTTGFIEPPNVTFSPGFRFKTCCLRLKSRLKSAGSSSAAGLNNGRVWNTKVTSTIKPNRAMYCCKYR